MATGGFRSNAATDFLEEWKAKREKMRAKMLGDIAASSGRSSAPGSEASSGGAAVTCVSARSSSSSSSSSSGLKRPEDDLHQTAAARAADGPPGSPKKVPASPQTEPGGNASDKESPGAPAASGKSKEKKSSGPSARKGKGQIEKRKLREKRRSTGVVSIPSNESLDELDDDDGSNKERDGEEALTQLNTFQNESMSADPGTAQLPQETPRGVTGHYKSASSSAADDDAGGNNKQRLGHSRQGSLERKVEELEKELARERQENARLLVVQQEKEELIEKLREEVDLLSRDLDDIEDENEQLKQENKTLLKVVGQLTR